MNSWRRALLTVAAAAPLATAGIAVGPGIAAAAADCTTSGAVVAPSTYFIQHADGTTNTVYDINNTSSAGIITKAGDTITGTFHVDSQCVGSVTLSAASYYTDSAVFSDESQLKSILFDQTTGSFAPGSTATLTIHIPLLVTVDTSNCPNPHLTSGQTYNGNGSPASAGNAYASTCDGSASQNGNGDGNANGKPCAGCVGNADNKNPQGQAPDGSDPNSGYECDTNNGVGKTNPAHSGCQQTTHFQVDFVVGNVITTFTPGVNYNGRKIAGGLALG